LFKSKGYSAVTMRDLATAMDMKAASLYNHISSKQELLKTIVVFIAEEFTNGMRQIQASEKSNIAKLKAIVALHVEITAKHTNGMAALNNDWMHLEDQLEHYLQLRTEYETSFLDIIEHGIASEEIKPSNPEIIMFSMLTTLRSLYLWMPKKGRLNSQELSQNLSDIMIDGIIKS
jgi:AcrR family transcriptional regulator